MSGSVSAEANSVVERLAAGGYWVAQAAKAVSEGRYSLAVRLCKEYLPDNPDLVSGHVIYGVALHDAGQTESAAEQFHRVLALDPDNLPALKYLGDLKFAAGEEFAALGNYRRILEIDPYCRGLVCRLERRPGGATRTVTLKRHAPEGAPARTPAPLRDIPFYTETIGDLYLAQGYSRMATTVYRRLMEQNNNPRLAEKLARAEEKSKEREE
jgi:tetratricopeptide (TPR) repeat protein